MKTTNYIKKNYTNTLNRQIRELDELYETVCSNKDFNPIILDCFAEFYDKASQILINEGKTLGFTYKFDEKSLTCIFK